MEKTISLAFLDAKKSALAGIVLIAIPGLFAAGAILNAYFGMAHLPDPSRLFDYHVGAISVLNDLIPLAFACALLAAILVNALVSIGLGIDCNGWRLSITAAIRSEFLNLAIVAAGALIAGVMLLYAIAENLHPH